MIQLSTEHFSGLRTVTAKFNAPLWARLTSADQFKVQSLIAHATASPDDLNRRSLVHQLSTPVDFAGTIIRSVRLKGILPQVDEHGVIPPHRGGDCNGYVPHPYLVKENGEVTIKTSNPGSPQGGLRAEKGEREFNATAQVAAGIADFPLCFGLYDGMIYNHEPIGFVGFGQESVEDRRFYKDYLFPLIDAYKEINCGIYALLKSPNLIKISFLFGQTLAYLHGNQAPIAGGRATTFAHSYPHFDNLGIMYSADQVTGVRLRDFEDCKPLGQLSPQQAYAHLFLDLSRVIFDYCSNNIADSGESWTDFNLAHLLPHFFRGYFGAQLPFQIGNEYAHPWATKTNEVRSVLTIMGIRNLIKSGRPVNIPETLARSPLGFIALLHKTLSRLSGLTN